MPLTPATPIVPHTPHPVPPYEELDEPSESIDADGRFRGTRVLKCLWPDRINLAQILRGGKVGRWRYSASPHPYCTTAMVSDIAIKPFGKMIASGIPTVAAYEYAQLTVNYEVPTEENQTDSSGRSVRAYMSERLEPAVEMITTTGMPIYLADGTKLRADQTPARIEKRLVWSITLNEVDRLPTCTFRLLGRVNDRVHTSRAYGFRFAPETLLYEPPQVARTINTDGSQSYQLTFKLNYNPDTWNMVRRTATATPESLYTDRTAAALYRIYQLADFSPILDYSP